MTKTIQLASFLLLLCFGNARGQTITGCNPNNTIAGASVTLIVTGSGTSFSSATGAYIYLPGPGGAFYSATNFNPSSNTNMSADFNIPPNAPIGNYSVGTYAALDLPNALNVGIGPGSAYGYISGYINYDYNTNCFIDPAEPGVPNRIVTIGNHNVATDVNGFYSAWMPLGNYTISSSSPPPFEYYTCGTSTSANLVMSLDSANNTNLYLDTLQVADLAVVMYISFFRPGFSVGVSAQVKNIGNVTSNPTTGYVLGSTMGINSVIPYTGGTVNGDTIFFNIPALAPGATYAMGFNGTLSVSATFGSTYSFCGKVFDVGSNDNGCISQTVTGSYDPNDKQVWDEDGNNADGFVEPGDSLLRYLIRFQNTGTDTAFNIFIRDTFSQHLDITTLSIEQASHPWTMNVNGDSVQWTFANVLLVDSTTNEPESHGYIGYSIKLKPGLPLGTQIDNTAHIYFDFNAPVVTNTVSTVICPEIMPSYTFSTASNTVNFSGTSVGAVTSWLWDFGDGNSSTSQNPVHTYASAGAYNVCLFTTNSCGRVDSICQTVLSNCAAPTSAFNSNVASTTVSFTDLSTGNPTSWEWDFGDGNSSTQANPTHNYASTGTYNVCLVVGSPCGFDTTCQTVNVTCATPVASYGNSVTGPVASFTDLSTGSPAGWFWTFGDGSTSNFQNPTHTYMSPGNYTVCLVVTSVCGADTMCNTVVVTCADPVASFNAQQIAATVSFIDQSTNAPTQWAWDFGDGNTSTLQSPSHTYTSSGTFTACLIASNSCGSDTNCLTLSVVVGIDNTLVNRFDLYPNPAQDRFVVDMELNEEALVDFRLYNAVGSLVQTEPQALLAGEVRKQFDVSSLPSGMYLLEMRINGQSRTWKVIKQ